MRFIAAFKPANLENRLFTSQWEIPSGNTSIQSFKSRTFSLHLLVFLSLQAISLMPEALAQQPPSAGDVGYASQPFVIQETYRQAAPETEPSPGIVGLDIQIHPSRYPLVRAVFQGTPAHRQGIRPGDAIIAVNGTYTKGKSREEVDALISDIPGDAIIFTLQRGTQIQRISLRVMALDALSATVRPSFSPLFQH